MDVGCRSLICLDDGAACLGLGSSLVLALHWLEAWCWKFCSAPVVLCDLSFRACQASTLAQRLSQSKQRLSGHGSHTVPPGSQMLHPSGFDASQGHPCTVHRQGAWISRPPVAVHARLAERI